MVQVETLSANDVHGEGGGGMCVCGGPPQLLKNMCQSALLGAKTNTNVPSLVVSGARFFLFAPALQKSVHTTACC